MSADSPFVIAVLRPGSPARARVADEAKRRRWDIEMCQASPLTAGSGRRLLVLGRCDAADLYVQFHRRPTAVLTNEDVHVRTQPASPLRDDRVVSLREFSRYKSYFSHLRSNRAEEAWSDEFSAWMGEVSCDGLADCRCLPFHIFTAKATYDLTLREERARFERDHRRRRARYDDRQLEWSPARPRARHGREPITISGYRLEDGFHWDVAARRKRTIATADRVWVVKNYLNVYPDGMSRFGDRCYEVWTRQDSARADAE